MQNTVSRASGIVSLGAGEVIAEAVAMLDHKREGDDIDGLRANDAGQVRGNRRGTNADGRDNAVRIVLENIGVAAFEEKAARLCEVDIGDVAKSDQGACGLKIIEQHVGADDGESDG